MNILQTIHQVQLMLWHIFQLRNRILILPAPEVKQANNSLRTFSTLWYTYK